MLQLVDLKLEQQIVFFVQFSSRRILCALNSIIVAILNTILFTTSGIESNLVLVGLNSVFSIALYVFLFYSAIQFYPHSVRTIGLALGISCYYLGSFLFLVY